MKPTFQIDHIVIMVEDLPQAIADYTALGFTTFEGGKHPGNPTYNALVVFQDGVYLEIIALYPGDETPPSPRLRKWIQASPGLVDFALLPADIEADVAAARERGLTVEDPQPGGRLRPDGQEIAWKTANFEGNGLPFFCFDVTPRSLRVPEGAVRQQANGVSGVADLTIAVASLKESAAKYRALLGAEPQPTPSDETLQAQVTAFSLGATTLTLAQPAAENSPLHPYLRAGGERPYRFTLRSNALKDSRILDPALSHSANIVLTGVEN
jgi:catechol 2,3-dioxygenase-like lactoylglutathione lyase family enzyme